MASVGEGSETGNIRNVIRIDEGEIRNHLDGLVKTSVEEVLNQYLDRRPTNFAVPSGTSGARDAWTLARAVKTASCRPRLARSPCRCPVCGRCLLRPKSLNGTSAGNLLLRKPWSRCTWPGSASVGWRTSRKPCGAPASPPRRLAS